MKDLQQGEFKNLIEEWTRNWLELDENAPKRGEDATLNAYVEEFTEALRKAWSEEQLRSNPSPRTADVDIELESGKDVTVRPSISSDKQLDS